MDFFTPFDYEPEEMYSTLSVTYEEFLQDLQTHIMGQDDVLPEIAYDIYSYVKSMYEKQLSKHNFILCGPSASGKTELYRTVKRLLKEYNCPIPVIHIDISGFSPAGFVGNNLNSIPERIAAQGSLGAAIVFLDEFDKILLPLYSSGNENFHSSLQYELLSLIEGKECSGSSKLPTAKMVDTNKTLFIAMGAFTDYRKAKEKKSIRSEIGFASLTKSNSSVCTNTLRMEDLLSVGGKTELIGRFDNLYNFYRMDLASFEGFFEKTIEQLAIEQQILITATDEACDEFYTLASSEFGCREVKRVLYQTIKHCLINAASIKNRINLRVVVNGINKAKLEIRKN